VTTTPHRGPTDFALAPTLRARLLGSGLAVVGVVVAFGMLLAWLAGPPAWLVSGLVVLGAVAVLGLGLVLGVRRWVVRLDEHGYRVRLIRSTQATTGRWTDVLDLQTTSRGGHRCVVLRLRDGRTTTIPVDLIEGDATAFTEALAAHLDRGHGYRRLG